MENIDGISSELRAEYQRDSDKGCMWQGSADGKVWPPVAEAFNSFPPGNIQRITIDVINLSERFNQIRCVALVAAKSSPNRVGVNCYSQVACGS